MAMVDAWIKLRTKLPKDGRLRVASRKCHAPSVTDVASESVQRNALVTLTLGALVRLWCLADEHADEEGVLFGYTPADVDAEVGVPGFCASLPADWVDLTGEWVKLPDYQEHNGTTGKSRAQATKRKQKERAGITGEKPSRNKRDADTTSPGQQSHVGNDIGVTREEKNREEPPVGSSSTSAKTEEEARAQARAVVSLCKVLLRLGMRDVHPARPELLELADRGCTPEQAALTVAELALRKAGMFDDPDHDPELLVKFASGCKPHEMHLTDRQFETLRASVPSLGYLKSTLIGRAQDAARNGDPNAKAHFGTYGGPARAGGGGGGREGVGARAERARRAAAAAGEEDGL